MKAMGKLSKKLNVQGTSVRNFVHIMQQIFGSSISPSILLWGTKLEVLQKGQIL